MLNDGMEIDVEATVLPSGAEPERQHGRKSGQGKAAEAQIPHRQDPVLVAAIASTDLTVAPGATTMLQVRLVNNGRQKAVFELLIEGWIDPAWLSANPVYRELQPGEQATVEIAITPPRIAASRAGARQAVVVLRSADYPDRESRQGVTLNLLSFDDMSLGEISPRVAHTSWRRRSADFRVPVTNCGNRPAQVRIQGEGSNTTFELRLSEGGPAAGGPFAAPEILVDLEAGETVDLLGTLHAQRMPLLRSRNDRYRILANVVGKQQVPRAASGRVVCHQRLGVRQILTAAALLLLIAMAFAMIGATGLGMRQLVASLPDVAGQSAATAPAPEPVIAVILPLDAIAPTANPTASASLAGGAPIVVSVADENTVVAPVTDETGRERSVRLIQAGEISAPGAAVPVPTPTAATSTRDGLTYAQMFQEIALRYDLDWRMLAAQAYVESKFDTLALGSDGDLGLMQVLPRTWQEWAPVVEVNDPFDAYSNALVAAIYLDYLRTFLAEQGHTEVRWMLVAYNWGPDKLDRFLADGNSWDDLPQSLQYYPTEILRIADSLSD